MKTTSTLLSLALTALFTLTACQSVETRIKEKPDVFAGLDVATQDKIKQGIIDLGYTQDMVYLALGEPDQKKESVSATGETVTWIYNSYYERYEGTHHAGYHRQVYFDPYLRTYRLHYRPVLVDSYSSEKEERIRVVFKDGKAAVIEQTKD
jgi:outer membrane protein assembly factor BamE (lipoprotein component of BamABCDE complex)